MTFHIYTNTYIFLCRELKWYNINIDDQKQIFFPTLQISEAKTFTRTRHYGPNDFDYFWFLYPKIRKDQQSRQMLEFRQALKITIYCNFAFDTFPFDSNECDFTFGSLEQNTKYLLLNSTKITYKHNSIHSGQGLMSLDESRLPYNVSLEILPSFNKSLHEFEYSYTGMKIYLRRNNIGQLVGSLYVPTSIFSLLSLVSYSIDIDMVCIVIQNHYLNPQSSHTQRVWLRAGCSWVYP